jgi:integrase
MGKLTQAKLPRLLDKPGRHGDGQGLFFRTLGQSRAYWVFRYRLDGKERELSLGPYPELGLIEARAKHAALRKQVVVDKVDVLAEKRAAKEAQAATPQSDKPSFGEVSDQYLKRKEERGQLGKNPKHRQQWRNTLAGLPARFRDLPINEIGPRQVFDALDPIWAKTPETASRLRGRIAAVLDFAREPEDTRPNPAAWSGWLKNQLGNPKELGKLDRKTGERLARGNHAAMPYAQVPAFMASLKAAPGVAPKALMFAILTAARSGEVFGMTWDEAPFFQATKLWTVPAERMKMGVEHQVPLSDAALDLLKAQDEARGKNPHVFPSPLPKQPLSTMALAMVTRRLKVGQFTVHGFRSSFRDWAADHGVEFEVAEACLAHAVGNAVTRAYLHTTMLERRRKALADWAAFLAGEEEADAKVVQVQFAGRAAGHERHPTSQAVG